MLTPSTPESAVETTKTAPASDRATLEVPFEELKGYRKSLQEEGLDLRELLRAERLGEMEEAARTRKEMLEHLLQKNPSLNGDGERVIEDLSLLEQEAETKKEWNLWEGAKRLPGRAWETVKAHPYLTAAVAAALLVAIAYSTGAVGPHTFEAIRSWVMTKFGPGAAAEAAREAAGAAAEAGAEAAEAAAEAVKGAAEAAGEILQPSPLPPPPPLTPPEIPDAETARKILEALEQGM
jgi:hypothetical protein